MDRGPFQFKMFSLSFITPSFAKQTVLTLCCLVLLALGIQGCSDSEDKAPTTPQKNQAPTTSVTVPKDPEVPSVIGEAGKDLVTGTKPEISSLKAQEELDNANQAVEKAEQLLQQAPMGKGSDLALSALKQDLDSARTLLQSSRTHYNDKKFDMAQAEARQATEKAATVSQHIEQAINTVRPQSR